MFIDSQISPAGTFGGPALQVAGGPGAFAVRLGSVIIPLVNKYVELAIREVRIQVFIATFPEIAF